MARVHVSLLLACVLLAFLPATACTTRDSGGGEAVRFPTTRAADTRAEVGGITASNLYDHERDWPYRVSLTESWKPEGRDRAFQAGTPGILVRLVDRDTARIDFAGLGVHEVPVADTDLVEQARRIAAGEIHKFGPNLLMAVGPRLMSSTGKAPVRMAPTIVRSRLVLLVFADPAHPGFGEMAEALAPLQSVDERFSAILFPQRDLGEQAVFDALKSAGWEVPFVQPHLSKGYTDGQLSEAVHPPVVLLTTGEGRLLYESAWRHETLRDLQAAIETHLVGIGAERSVPQEGRAASESALHRMRRHAIGTGA
jgi:hypothetical protein